jgi:hypothetical protein
MNYLYNINNILSTNYIKKINNNINNTNFDECSICLEYLYQEKENNIYYFFKIIKNIFNNNDDICILSCNHIFHKKCILEWLEKEKTCPLCRVNLKIMK